MKLDNRLVVCQIVSVMALSLNLTAAHGNTLNLRANPTILSRQSGMKMPDATGGMCAKDPTPRVLGVNGVASNIVFKPGGNLKVNGCGLGNGGHAWLTDNQNKVPLVIDSWNNNYIQAHIDSQISGVLDLHSAQIALAAMSKRVFIHSTQSFGQFVARRSSFMVNTNLSRYLTMGIDITVGSQGGWGKPLGNYTVAMEPDGTVRRFAMGLNAHAEAFDYLVFKTLKPDLGFKLTSLKLQCLNLMNSNGVTDTKTGHVVRSKPCTLTQGPDGVWTVGTGEVFIQNHNDLHDVACTIASGPADNCQYSIYRISAVLEGSIGAAPPMQ